MVTHKHDNLTIVVHPIVYSHLTKGLFSNIRRTWQRKLKTPIKIKANSDYYFTEFKFFDANDEEIKV